jgi:hypothetical protein
MSLHLEFEPHSWHMGFAITNNPTWRPEENMSGHYYKWYACTANGNTYQIDDLYANTLKDLKKQIKEYHLCKHNGYGERLASKRLEYLRGELRAERISYGELAELFKLHEYIKPGDVELLGATGVPKGETK